MTGTVAYTNNNDTCKASGTSGIAVEVEDFGGDDAPIIIRKRKKKTLREQPNKHLDYILDKAIEAYGKIVEEAPKAVQKEAAKIVRPFTESKAAVPQPESIDFKALERDAEKVAQLLEMYQQQVRAMEDDEDLIMLIAEFF